MSVGARDLHFGGGSVGIDIDPVRVHLIAGLHVGDLPCQREMGRVLTGRDIQVADENGG